MPFFAHSASNQPHDAWQPLREHLAAVAQQAGDFAQAFGSEKWAFICGLLHDLGKYALEFQKRLTGGKRVDHSLAGALEVIMFLESSRLAPLGKTMAHVISGHHTGLADGNPGQIDAPSLKDRLAASEKIPDYSAWKTEISLPETAPSLPAFAGNIRQQDMAFSVFFWTRMLYSCLVDADFLDTEAFLQPGKAAVRGGYPTLAQLHIAFNTHMMQKSATAKPGKVNEQRANVLAACRQAALQDQGLFSLTVPTGGGKTLSSLAFAFDHAARHSLRRIIYVIPYTSIIEQTAEVFRAAFGPRLAHAVLEHHAHAGERLEKHPEAADHNEDGRSLAFENWDAPIIVTTAVQFFESLFAARSSRCRKLHRIAGSVVVLDEAQTLPMSLFRPCLAAIKELSGMYKTSLVLCTATQPEVGVKPWNRNGLEHVREIVPDVSSVFQALERVQVEYIGTLDMPTLAERFARHDRALCIVNTKAQARDLYESLRASLHDEKPVFHLSTWMCPAHRKAVLRQINDMLHDPQTPPLLLVATSLIEAGVDQDWPVVYRAMSGVDSIAQAAGRCNREGSLQWGQTFVFDFPELQHGEQARRKNAAEAVRRAGLPFLTPQATALYFDEIHSLAGANMLDKADILRRVAEHAGSGMFPFRSVERDFRIIDDYEVPLIILYDADARAVLDRLRAGEADRALYRRLQQWSVGVPEKCLRELLTKSLVETVGFARQHHVLINEDLYNGLQNRDKRERAPGLDLRNPVFREIEGLVV